MNHIKLLFQKVDYLLDGSGGSGGGKRKVVIWTFFENQKGVGSLFTFNLSKHELLGCEKHKCFVVQLNPSMKCERHIKVSIVLSSQKRPLLLQTVKWTQLP